MSQENPLHIPAAVVPFTKKTEGRTANASSVHPLVEEMTLRKRGQVAQLINRIRYPKIEPDFKAKDWILDV